jgi:hypothetical protein
VLGLTDQLPDTGHSPAGSASAQRQVAASALPDDWMSPRPTIHRTAVDSPMTYDAMWRETVNAWQRRVGRLDGLTW